MRTGVTTTYDLYRPFGAGAPLHTNQPCVIYDDASCGRGSGLSGILLWTHYMDVPAAQDVLDGCTRFGGSDGLVYSDGDEVRAPSGGACKFVVVFVSEFYDDVAAAKFKRVYMLRDTFGVY